jgi:hypothetical protein
MRRRKRKRGRRGRRTINDEDALSRRIPPHHDT